MLTQKRLKQLVHYNPETGVFTRASCTKRSGGRIGDTIGNRSSGYLQVSLDGEQHLLHRLAFLYMTGEFPSEVVDHRNKVRDDNRWSNLRACTRSENEMNKVAGVDNEFGEKGLVLHRRKGRSPRIQGSVAYSVHVINPDGSKERKQTRLSFSRIFIEGDEESINKAVSEVREWLRVTREKYHGSFCNHD